MRVIKRFRNRKLYDTTDHCYSTLSDLANIIRNGEDFRVIDNDSGNDITYMTQIQILFNRENEVGNSLLTKWKEIFGGAKHDTGRE